MSTPLLGELEQAKTDVETAERQLEAVLAEIRVAPRAEKTAVSSAIEAALERLRAARGTLARAESAITGDPPR